MNELLQAQIFSGFTSWKSLDFLGEVTPKILRFEVRELDEVRPFYLAAMISKEEKMAWQSFQDVLEHTVTLAQNNLRGFFGFDVLSVDLRTGIRNFDPKALGQLIINHSRTLGPDQKALIRYGQLFALLHYRAPAEWGKVEVKTHVEFFSQESKSSLSNDVSEASVRAALLGGGMKKNPGGQLDLFLKKLLSETRLPAGRQGQESNAIYFAHDLSVHPIWDPANEMQQQRVCAWLEKERQARGGVLPEIYLHDVSSGMPRELK